MLPTDLLAFHDVVAVVKKIQSVGDLRQVHTDLFRHDRGVEFLLVGVQQISQAALGHFHSDDNVAPVHQDIVNLNEAGMFQLADGLNGLDLTRRGHVVPAGNEFEGQQAALGFLNASLVIMGIGEA